jgi:GNAT superfamily N-acetyltransferase
MNITMQPVRPADIPLLMKIFPEGGPDKHSRRLARQQQGDVTYLIAWYLNQPVGHGMVKWQRPQNDPIAPHLEQACPDIEDLFVLEELRSRGIGTQILHAAEELARGRGYKQIGLSAGAELDDPARKLYQRLGYRDIGIGEFTERYEYVDQDGQFQVWEGACVYLVKHIE